jgi:hypothetical protein
MKQKKTQDIKQINKKKKRVLQQKLSSSHALHLCLIGLAMHQRQLDHQN